MNAENKRLWLVEKRKSKGLTQNEVSDIGNFSRSYYAAVESGIHLPSVAMAKSISKVLDFEWAMFFEDK